MKSKTEAMKERIEEAIEELKNKFDSAPKNPAEFYRARGKAMIECEEKILKLLSEEKEKEAVEFYNWATKEQVSNPNLILSTSTAELFQLFKSQQND